MMKSLTLRNVSCDRGIIVNVIFFGELNRASHLIIMYEFSHSLIELLRHVRFMLDCIFGIVSTGITSLFVLILITWNKSKPNPGQNETAP